MIVVRVELWSARTGQRTELARAVIVNDGSAGGARRSYIAAAYRGRSTAALDKGAVQRQGRVRDFPSARLHVWNLVAAALAAMGYGHNSHLEEG